MSCLPTYKGKRYNSLEELYKANNIKVNNDNNKIDIKTNNYNHISDKDVLERINLCKK